MLQMDESAAAIIRKCLGSLTSLSSQRPGSAHRDRKVSVSLRFNMVNNDGTLGELVDLHAGMYMQHGTSAAFPGTASSFYCSKKHCITIIPMSASLIGLDQPEEQHSRTGWRQLANRSTRQPAPSM